MTKLKMINVETGQYTKIKLKGWGEYDFGAAADRLAARERPGYYAGGHDLPDFDRYPDRTEFEREFCRPLGDLEQHTGEFFHVRIEEW